MFFGFVRKNDTRPRSSLGMETSTRAVFVWAAQEIPGEIAALILFITGQKTCQIGLFLMLEIVLKRLCLSASHADCIPPRRRTGRPTGTLPQRVPRGLHRVPGLSPATAETLPQRVPRGLHRFSASVMVKMAIFASARPTRIASAKMHMGRRNFLWNTL